jgi:hypothetical protein
MDVKPLVKASAIALGALFIASAFASPAGAKDKKADKDDPNRMVCRTLTMSGSRISSRYCRTKADWDRDERETQDAALQQHTGPGYRPPPEGPAQNPPR